MKTPLALIFLFAATLPLSSSVLMRLDPATAAYDGLAVDDGGTTGGSSGISQPVLANGFTFNITFTPTAADLSGTVLLMEIGGTSNGSGLYLIDGVPTFISKQGSNDATLPTSLNDTSLPTIAVQSSVGTLVAGTEYSLASAWNHAGKLDLAVFNGTTLTPDTFTITGTPGDWSGNESLSVGIKTSNASTGGLSGNDASSNFGPPFDVHECKGVERIGNISRAIYWNRHAPVIDASNELVPLAPASANYDSSISGNTATPASTAASGHVVRLELTPAATDLAGSVLLFEYGGSSNGFSLILVDGVLTYSAKHNSGDNQAPDSLNDTSLNNACVQSAFGPLTAGTSYVLAAAWDQAGELQLGVKSPDGTLLSSFKLTGAIGNWVGNNTLGFGQLNGSAGGLGGELAGVTVPDPWDVDETPVKPFTGTRTRALFWNTSTALNPGFPDPWTLATDKVVATGTGNVTLNWTAPQVIAGGIVEITANKPVSSVSSTGDATAGSATYAVDGSLGKITFTATYKNADGQVVAIRRRLVEGVAAPGTLVRPWLGPETFTSPMFDWRRTADRYECLYAGPNRRVDLLSRQLQPTSSLEMMVELVRLDAAFNGLAGFRFAAKGAIKQDYRHNIIQSFGFDAGLNSSGSLVLADQSVPADFPLGEWQKLRLVLTPNGPNHDVTLEQIDPSTSSVLASVSKSIPSSSILGNLLLLSDSTAAGSWGSPVTAFRNWTHSGSDLTGSDDQHWGPILFTQYTLSKGTLKLSAQFAPLAAGENRTARLEVDSGSGWSEVATAPIEQTTELALFRIENWDDAVDTPFRVLYLFGDTNADVVFEGTIRRDPVDQDEFSIGALTCMRDLNFPNQEPVNGLMKLDPDVLFFSGDQYYEDDYGYTPKIQAPFERARLDMLRKWFMWGWSFRDVTRDRPCICILDDHDNWMSNLWGSGGKALSGALENGGYLMPPAFVNASQRVQTAHLPDPYDPAPVMQGIEVYYTDMLYGRVSMAILEDRKFKSGPNEVGSTGVPTLADAVLLGDRQHAFVDAWARDWAGADFKTVLSQSVFDQVHTHAGSGGAINPIVGDPDSNGWPGPASSEAVRRLRKAFPFMIGGDNHLPTLSHLGVDTHEDAFLAYSNPATAVGFPRKWDPANDSATAATKVVGFPAYAASNFAANPTYNGFPYLGRYTSDFGHPQTIVAIGNPTTWGGNVFGDVAMLDAKSSGIGIVRYNKKSRDIVVEAYRIGADFTSPAPAQFTGWPVTIRQTDNYGRAALAYLPLVEDPNFANPVFEIIDESNDSLVYSIRSWTPGFRPHVFTSGGSYTIRYGAPETDTWVELTGQTPAAIPPVTLNGFTASKRFIVAGESVDLLWDAPGGKSIGISQGVGDVTLRTFNGIGTTSVSPTADTTYVLSADDGGTPVTASVTVRVFPSYADWREANFSPAELLDPLVSGDGANPDSDPFDNFTEYLLQFDPRNSDPALSGEIVALSPGFKPSFNLPEPLLAGYRWQLETSTDLNGQWIALDESEVETMPGDIQPQMGTPRIIIAPIASWPGPSPRSFMRARLVEEVP